jgi:hypothetical protein
MPHPSSSLSADTLLRLMNRERQPPPPAALRPGFLSAPPDDVLPSDDSPRDTVTELLLSKSTTQLISWDQDGRPGPAMFIAADAVSDADADYLLERCRQIYRSKHPERTLHIV